MLPTTVLELGLDTSSRPLKMTARMKAAFDEACALSGVTPVIVQGAFMGAGSADASAGTHERSGCLDLRTWNLTTEEREKFMKAARSIGWAVWYRTEAQGFDPHMHALLLGEPDMHPDAVAQEEQYRAGLNGLASRGPDDFWRPDPIPTYRYEEDEMSAEDIERIDSKLDKLTELIKTQRDALKVFRHHVLKRDRAMAAELEALTGEVTDDVTKKQLRKLHERVLASMKEDEEELEE